MGPGNGLDDMERRKLLPLPGLKLQPLSCPARSQLLYQQRYPSSHTRQHTFFHSMHLSNDLTSNAKSAHELVPYTGRGRNSEVFLKWFVFKKKKARRFILNTYSSSTISNTVLRTVYILQNMSCTSETTGAYGLRTSAIILQSVSAEILAISSQIFTFSSSTSTG